MHRNLNIQIDESDGTPGLYIYAVITERPDGERLVAAGDGDIYSITEAITGIIERTL